MTEDESELLPYSPPQYLANIFIKSQSTLCEHFHLVNTGQKHEPQIYVIKLKDSTLLNHILLLPLGYSLASVIGQSSPNPIDCRAHIWCNDLSNSICLPFDEANKLRIGELIKLNQQSGSIQDSIAFLSPIVKYQYNDNEVKFLPKFIVCDTIFLAGIFDKLTICIIGQLLENGSAYKLLVNKYINCFQYSGLSTLINNLDLFFVAKLDANYDMEFLSDGNEMANQNSKNISIIENFRIEEKQKYNINKVSINAIANYSINEVFVQGMLNFCMYFSYSNDYIEKFWINIMELIKNQNIIAENSSELKLIIEAKICCWCRINELGEIEDKFIDIITMLVTNLTLHNMKIEIKNYERMFRLAIMYFASNILYCEDKHKIDKLIMKIIELLRNSFMPRFILSSLCELLTIFLINNTNSSFITKCSKELMDLMSKIQNKATFSCKSEDIADYISTITAIVYLNKLYWNYSGNEQDIGIIYKWMKALFDPYYKTSKSNNIDILANKQHPFYKSSISDFILYTCERIQGINAYNLRIKTGVPLIPISILNTIEKSKCLDKILRCLNKKQAKSEILDYVHNIFTEFPCITIICNSEYLYELSRYTNSMHFIIILLNLRRHTYNMVSILNLLHIFDGKLAFCIYINELLLLNEKYSDQFYIDVLLEYLNGLRNETLRKHILYALTSKKSLLLELFDNDSKTILNRIIEIIEFDNIDKMLEYSKSIFNSNKILFSVSTDISPYIRKGSGLCDNLNLGKVAYAKTKNCGGFQLGLDTIIPNIFVYICDRFNNNDEDSDLKNEEIEIASSLIYINLVTTLLFNEHETCECMADARYNTYYLSNCAELEKNIYGKVNFINSLHAATLWESIKLFLLYCTGIIRICYPTDLVELLLQTNLSKTTWFDGIHKWSNRLLSYYEAALENVIYILTYLNQIVWVNHRLMDTELMTIIACLLYIAFYHKLTKLEEALSQFLTNYVKKGNNCINMYIFNWLSFTFRNNDIGVYLCFYYIKKLLTKEFFDSLNSLTYHVVKSMQAPPMVANEITKQMLLSNEVFYITFSELLCCIRTNVTNFMLDDNQILKIAGEPLEFDIRARNIIQKFRTYLCISIPSTNYTNINATESIKLYKAIDTSHVYSFNIYGENTMLSSSNNLTYDIFQYLLWTNARNDYSVAFYEVLKKSQLAVEALVSCLDNLILVITESNNKEFVRLAYENIKLFYFMPIYNIIQYKLEFAIYSLQNYASINEKNDDSEGIVHLHYSILRILICQYNLLQYEKDVPVLTNALNSILAALQSNNSSSEIILKICIIVVGIISKIVTLHDNTFLFPLIIKFRTLITSVNSIIQAAIQELTNDIGKFEKYIEFFIKCMAILSSYYYTRVLLCYDLEVSLIDNLVFQNTNLSNIERLQIIKKTSKVSLIPSFISLINHFGNNDYIKKQIKRYNESCIPLLQYILLEQELNDLEKIINIELSIDSFKLDTIIEEYGYCQTKVQLNVIEKLLPNKAKWIVTPTYMLDAYSSTEASLQQNNPFGLVYRLAKPLIIKSNLNESVIEYEEDNAYIESIDDDDNVIDYTIISDVNTVNVNNTNAWSNKLPYNTATNETIVNESLAIGSTIEKLGNKVTIMPDYGIDEYTTKIKHNENNEYAAQSKLGAGQNYPQPDLIYSNDGLYTQFKPFIAHTTPNTVLTNNQKNDSLIEENIKWNPKNLYIFEDNQTDDCALPTNESQLNTNICTENTIDANKITLNEEDPIIKQFYKFPGFYELINDCANNSIDFLYVIKYFDFK